jgi:hypothetical protein
MSGTIAMLHHPHFITPHNEYAMTQHIALNNCCLDNQLCATPHQYLGTLAVRCLFISLLYPGDICVLVCVKAVDNRCTSTNIIGKVGHVGAVMTNCLQPLHETTEDPVPCAPIYLKMFPKGLIFP